MYPLSYGTGLPLSRQACLRCSVMAHRWPLFRDAALFFAGVLGVAHETLGDQPERPTLLILFAAMMGLPAFLQKEPPKKEDQ